jgi:glycosyltransferase involved in cell wall biosynthesis
MSTRWRDRKIFMFFATPNLGGAERVHAQIVQAVSDINPVVVFTEPPRNALLLPLYTPHCTPVMLHGRKRSRFREFFSEARIAAEINRARNPVVLGAFSHFFYNLVPRLRPHVRCVDLIHNFGVQFEHFSLPHVERLAARVVLSLGIRSELATLCEAFGAGHGLTERIRVIPNGVAAPPSPPNKPDGPLNVLYVGRPTPEKRVHLIADIVAELAARKVDARVTLVGDLEKSIPEPARAYCSLEGVITDPARLDALYDAAHILLLTSSREGLPMAMLEAMARGAVPVVPDVGAIGEHVKHGVSGVLLNPEPEPELVRQAVGAIARLAKHRGALATMSKAAHAHVREHCSDTAFRSAWREVLIGAGNE